MARAKFWEFHYDCLRRPKWITAPAFYCLIGMIGYCTTAIAQSPDHGLPKQTAPVVPAPAADYPIDIETALSLAGAENPTIALALEAVRARLAEQMGARALLLPTLDAGMNFNVHRGNLQSSQGVIEDVDRQALYAGAGAGAIGAGTVSIPGIRVTAHLADAVFAPRIAQEQVVSSRLQALATQYAVLLDVSTRYFELVGAEASLSATRQSEEDLAEVVRITANFARSGQGRDGDAQRAKSEALLLHVQEEHAEEAVAVAAAALAERLNLDPAIQLRGPGGPLPLIQLIDPRENLENLIQIALSNNPEIAARTADIAATEIRLRQEKVRPFVPLLSAGVSAGEFGGGSDQTDLKFGHFNGRTDFDVLAVWSLQNLGFGNLAVQRRVRTEVDQAVAERARVINRIRREIAEAQALSTARRLEVDLARRRVETAQRAYRLDLTRTKNIVLKARPIEVLNSFTLLNAARQELIRAIIDYDQAQFQLFVSLGQPPDAALQR
jgi:outer membrane protein TolC